MSCAMCGEPFDEESDVVVCPECGAPHHRDCWKETGHCACEEKHAEGYEWHPEKMYIGDVKFPPDSEKEPLASGDDETERCPNCGKMTKKSEKYCEYCGYYKYVEPDSFSDMSDEARLEELFPFDPAEKIQGVPAGDYKRFVGRMWIYYCKKLVSDLKICSSSCLKPKSYLLGGITNTQPVNITLISLSLRSTPNFLLSQSFPKDKV